MSNHLAEIIIGYLRNIEITDNWGTRVFDIILKGLTIDEIDQLKARVTEAYQQLVLTANAYFSLIYTNLHLPGKENIRSRGDVNFNGITRTWEYSFSEARVAIPSKELEYESAVNAIKSFIPFFYIFVFLKQGQAFKTPEQIYIKEEQQIFGGSIIDHARNTINRTNDTIEKLKSTANKYWFSARLFERERKMAEITTKTNTLFNEEVSCYAPTPEAEAELKRTERLDDILIRWESLKRDYAEDIILENDVYEGRWTIPHVPVELSLVGERRLPTRPPRPTPEEIWIGAEKKNPILEDRPFSDKELYCFEWIKVSNELQRNFNVYSKEYEELGCAEKRGEYFRCKFLNEFADVYYANKEVLFTKRGKYPEPIQEGLQPIPVYIEPTEREFDRENIIYDLDQCKDILGGVTRECLLKYYTGIEAYNAKYAPTRPSVKNGHRIKLVRFYLDVGRNQLTEISIKAYQQLIDEYQRVYEVTFDDSQLLPKSDDWTLLEHSNLGLIVKEKEYDDILKTIILRDKTSSESAVIEQVSIEDRVFESVYNERDFYNVYRMSSRTDNLETWKRFEAIAKNAVIRFNPLVREFIKNWGVEPDYGTKENLKVLIKERWQKTPPYDYLGV